jgi:hypothetical protein
MIDGTDEVAIRINPESASAHDGAGVHGTKEPPRKAERDETMTRHTTRIPAMVVLSWSALGIGAKADITITTPAGLSPGDQFRIVFVTDGSTTSTYINIYDCVVNTDVTNAGGVFYNGQSITNWLAIASTATVNAIDHIGSSANSPVYDIADNRVASSTTAGSGGLWSGSLLSPIVKDLQGTNITAFVWTGTQTDGTADPSLPLGSTNPSGAVTGVSTKINNEWIDSLSTPTAINQFIYGISPILTVPGSSGTVVPEPSTAIVAAFGAVAFIAYGWSRRRQANQGCSPWC